MPRSIGVSVLVVLAVACAGGDSRRTTPPPAERYVPRLAPGLLGDWVRVAPASLAGDTLSLHADSTAQGIVPWPPRRMARISRWKVRFGSKDPVGSRRDWRQGYADGGDPECTFREAMGA